MAAAVAHHARAVVVRVVGRDDRTGRRVQRRAQVQAGALVAALWRGSLVRASGPSRARPGVSPHVSRSPDRSTTAPGFSRGGDDGDRARRVQLGALPGGAAPPSRRRSPGRDRWGTPSARSSAGRTSSARTPWRERAYGHQPQRSSGVLVIEHGADRPDPTTAPASVTPSLVWKRIACLRSAASLRPRVAAAAVGAGCFRAA